VPFKLSALAVACALACLSAPVLAHHSNAAQYRDAEETTIQGVVVQIAIRNPHSFLYVSAPNHSGEARLWAVECGTARQIGQHHEPQLKPGDIVIVTGNPGRVPATGRMRMKHIVRPSDGRRWDGSSR
jgi:co-chaperonin GroES (HSP10)